MSPPTVDQFLGEIAQIIQERNGGKLRDYLAIEPPFGNLYMQLVSELKQAYPNNHSQEALEAKCTSFISEYDDGEDGGSNLSFIALMVRYFVYLRDLNIENLVETHEMLKALLNQATVVLSSYLGLVVLPTIIVLSRTLSRLAIGLDKRPDLIASLEQRRESTVDEESAEKVTLVESSANAISAALNKCLGDRSGGSGRPEGRRIAIYQLANTCFMLFFHCKKLRNAETLFKSIYQQSPPLNLYPASQRVTYLYYLGRYHFANNHFFRAQLALQEAYNQCPAHFISQRRLIITYLITSNIILGRFPASTIWQRPEAAGLHEKYGPICTAIKLGDLASFRRHLNLESNNAEWFLRKRILLQLSNRCEVLVWRSLARRTFMLSGSVGDAANKRAPTMALQDMVVLAQYLEKKATAPHSQQTNGMTNGGPRRVPHTNSIFMSSNGSSNSESAGFRDSSKGYTDPDLEGAVEPASPVLSTMDIVESTVTSLVEQDFLHGFISHSSHRFAITGAKNAPPVQVGFPKVWDVVKARADDEVPGWVKEAKRSAFGPGMVVNLSGARPAGSAG